MAFANLFKTLSPAEEHHAVPCEAPHPHKNGVQEACPPRRQKPDGQKKRKTSQHLNQAMTAKTPRPPPFYDYDHPDGVPSGPAHFKRRGRGQFHHRGASSQPPMDQRVQRQQFQNTTTFKQEMQQQNMGPKKRKTMKNNKQQENACRSNRGGFHQGERREWFPRGRGRGRGQTQMHQHMRDPAVERVRSMTQEFKDQNALEAEGQLLCKHFLMGRCNKGEECQLVHRSAHNDLIKEVCKFYVQGACFKEESCAYMHSSFPCKFFHQRGKCLKEEDCRFSHEPLTDLSKQLLDQALQREKDLSEMAKKSQQEGVAPPAVEDQKGAGEEASGPEPHILLHPIRPQFYNSSCPEEPLPERQGLTGTEPGRGPAPPSCCPPNPKVVPYSVEAVLGPVISKPFPTLFGSSRDLPSASPPRRSCAPPPAPAHQEAPYSVEAVLRSVPSVGGSTLTSARDPPPSANLPLTYYGSDRSKEFPKPSWFSGLFSGEDLCLKHDTRQAIEAKARPNGNGDVPPWNQDHQQAERCLPVSQRVPPCSQSSSEGHGVGHANRSTGARVPPGQPDTPPAKGTQKAFRSLFANPLNQNVFNPPHLAPLPAAAPSPTRATPSTNSRKEKTSADADTNTGHNTHVLGRSVTVKPAHRPSEVAPPAVPPGSELRSTESPGPVPHAETARSVSKPAPCDGCVLGRSRPVKRPYHSRTAGSGRGSREEPPPSQITTDLRAEAVTAPGGVLRGLFATPIHQTTALPVTACAAPPHPGGGSSEHHPQNSRATGSPASRPDPKHPKQKERKSRSNNHQPPAHSVQKDSDMPEISLDKAPSHDATNSSNSVLKTLFLNLRPYNQEEERLIHSKSGDKEEIKHRAVSKERQTGEQRDEEEETRRKETRSTEMFVAVEPAGRHVHPDHQLQGSGGPPSLPPARLRPLGQSPPTRCPGPSGGCPAGRLHPIQLPSHSAVHPPIGSTGPLAQPQTSVEGPLRSLFKTLDPAASPFGS